MYRPHYLTNTAPPAASKAKLNSTRAYKVMHSLRKRLQALPADFAKSEIFRLHKIASFARSIIFLDP
jgi:hypothetical protein